VLCTFTSVRRPAPPAPPAPPTPPADPPADPPAPPAPPVDECGATGAEAAPGCEQPPAPETGEACLKRPVLTWVRGRGIKRVVFYLDGKRKATVTRPDAEGRYGLRTDRRTLSNGKHEVRAQVYFKRVGRAPKTLRFTIEPCLKLETSTAIETTKPGELDACAGGTFTAFVRGDTIRRVIFYLDGRKLKSTHVADWRGRYWVSVKPGALSVGSHRLRARMYFISGSRQRSRELELEFRRCGG
jgi:hypothetical protein